MLSFKSVIRYATGGSAAVRDALQPGVNMGMLSGGQLELPNRVNESINFLWKILRFVLVPPHILSGFASSASVSCLSY